MKWNQEALDEASDVPPDEALSCRRRAWEVPYRRFFKGSAILRRVLRGRLVRASVRTGVLGRVLRRGGVVEGLEGA